MTVRDLWLVCPKSHIFIVDGSFKFEFLGCLLSKYSNSVVKSVFATSYPSFKSVLEVEIYVSQES